jgi:hypothetical protein
MDEVKAILDRLKQKNGSRFNSVAVENLVIPRGLEPLLPT